MHRKHFIMLLGLLGSSVGCVATAPQFSAQQQAQIATVSFIKPYELSRTDVTHISRGEVIGQACPRGHDTPSSEQQALLELKLAAAAQQANVVVLKHCAIVATSSCGRIWQCRGDAHQQQPVQ